MSAAEPITYIPIGVVRSPVTRMSEGNWGQVESEIHLDAPYAAGLQGLEEFSHAMVLFHLHEVKGFDPGKQLLRHPRGMEHLREVGVFAQRTKYRPNPIGVSAVELRAVRGNVLVVRGLDALDGTPVLDLKPYIPMFDRVEHARTPEWVVHFTEGYM
jgi:tRNA-Thr(GGU) m(6)t(6)A37 methyltransferase TsaA